VELWKSRDPIPAFGNRLVEEEIATEAQLEEIRQQALATVAEAVAFAEESPWPEDGEVWEDIYV
jgi:pyruvate dehydrogenase E1 component alpha subunit